MSPPRLFWQRMALHASTKPVLLAAELRDALRLPRQREAVRHLPGPWRVTGRGRLLFLCRLHHRDRRHRWQAVRGSHFFLEGRTNQDIQE